ncbi:MAG: tetratricopeptide repeat protein, partial [Saprospiraceae bacterium]
LAGNLPAAEAHAFEAEVAADPLLAAEVQSHRTAHEALDRLAELQMRQNIETWLSSTDPLPKPPPEPFWKWWMTIPLALVAALAVWCFWPTTPPRLAPPPEQTTTPPTSPIPPKGDPKPPTSQPAAQPAAHPKYIALVENGLLRLQENIALKYGQTMGGDGGTGSAAFEQGAKAFREKNWKTAQKTLRQVSGTDGTRFAAAQEMLACLYFREKKYAEAARRYETYAAAKPGPDTDLHLLQFYLADYENRRAAFQKLLNEMLDPANEHKHRDAAEKLKAGM